MPSGGKKKIVLLGMMSKMPVAGVVWQTVHYLLGLERLGYEAYYVEAHARTPSTFVLGEREEADDGTRGASDFIAGVMRPFGLERRWAFHALHSTGACHGMDLAELNRLYDSAAVIINLHGGTMPLAEHARTGRLVYLETDPVALQIELYHNVQETVDFLKPHVAFFTFGENYGRPGCRLPVDERFRFLPTRQPVVLDLWSDGAGPLTMGNDGELSAFTTIGNWQQPWREVTFEGEVYHWSKHYEFLKFLDLPKRTGRTFELALSSYDEGVKSMLEERGWRVRHALDLSKDPDEYRAYVARSKGEFTVAKDQNVRLRTGWFSDRSATYLAAGRPVITQDTGFGDVLPTGEGLFAFSTLDEAAHAVERIDADYDRHRRAARRVARECFAHDVVLPRLLGEVGL
jgi:hypothetical protein